MMCGGGRVRAVPDPARLQEIFEALEILARRAPVVFPLHPRTRRRVTSAGFEELLVVPRIPDDRHAPRIDTPYEPRDEPRPAHAARKHDDTRVPGRGAGGGQGVDGRDAAALAPGEWRASGALDPGRSVATFLRMRKVVLWIGMSFDGFTSGVNEQLDWLVPYVTAPEGMAIFRKLRERSDTILLGRVNYEGFFGYWPRVKDDPKASPDDVAISRWLDDVPKVVFSRSLRDVAWKNARLAKGSAAEEVGALKRAPGKDIIIQNSTRLTRRGRSAASRAW